MASVVGWAVRDSGELAFKDGECRSTAPVISHHNLEQLLKNWTSLYQTNRVGHSLARVKIDPDLFISSSCDLGSDTMQNPFFSVGPLPGLSTRVRLVHTGLCLCGLCVFGLCLFGLCQFGLCLFVGLCESGFCLFGLYQFGLCLFG